MSIEVRLQDEILVALKAGDKLRLNCLRMLKSKMQEKTVESRAKQGRDYTLTDEEVLAVISGYAKQRRDSIEAYRLGGRAEMLVKEEAELAIVCEYLPQQLTEEELVSIVTQAISESGATGPRDMGAVMKLVVSATKGRADGKVVSQLVRDRLSG
jgi:uncharacterized protein YqeY